MVESEGLQFGEVSGFEEGLEVVIGDAVRGEVQVQEFARGKGQSKGESDVVVTEIKGVQRRADACDVGVLAQVEYFEGCVATAFDDAIIGSYFDVAEFECVKGVAVLY